MLELKHFNLLTAISETGTISGSARLLGYSQPAISQQIQRLESYLRTPVLTRSTSGVRLTEVGQILLRHGTQILGQLALARSEVEAITDLRAGLVRVASFPSAAATIIPPALGSMNRQHPGISFSLAEAEVPQALELVRSGECEIAVVYEYATAGEAIRPLELGPDERAVLLTTEDVWVALPSSENSERTAEVDLQDLAAARWISGCPSCRGNLLDVCSRAGFAPDIRFETDDYIALQALIAESLGVALLPDLMRVASRREDHLDFRTLKGGHTRKVFAVTTEQLAKVPAVGATVQALRSAGEQVLVG